jgi:hypothetical protein
MPTPIADYLTFADNPVTLVHGGSPLTWNFNLANAVQLNQPMVLLYFYQSHEDANLAFRFTINGQNIGSTNSIFGVHFSTVHEIFPGSICHHGVNTLRAEVTSGTGHIDIGELVLLNQRFP